MLIKQSKLSDYKIKKTFDFKAILIKSFSNIQITADNMVYLAHSVHPNFCFAKTSFMLGSLYEIVPPI
jgi:hypothetical protein